MKIDFDDAQIKSIVGEAIVASFDEKKRDAIIKSAIEHLLTPERSGYSGRSISPIEAAFRDAVVWQARRMAQEMIENDEAIVAQLKSIMADAVAKVFADRQRLVDNIANAIERGLMAQ